MLKWIVAYIEDNKENWEKIGKEKMEERMDARMEKFADIVAEKLEQVIDKLQNQPVATN